VRRPSPALLISVLALFIALGGPAQARRLIGGKDIRKGAISSRQVKDHSLSTRDLSNAAVRSLRQTPTRSITETKLADGAVTNAKLAGAAVTGSKLAANSVTPVAIADGSVVASKLADASVTGAKIADGSLTTLDVARFAGRFRVLPDDIGTIHPRECWHGEPRGLAPELAGADISQDAVFVAPRGGFNELATSFSWRTSPAAPPDPASLSRFVIALCNVTATDYTAPSTGIAFSYVVFDIP
jgi:hypothetical protein